MRYLYKVYYGDRPGVYQTCKNREDLFYFIWSCLEEGKAVHKVTRERR